MNNYFKRGKNCNPISTGKDYPYAIDPNNKTNDPLYYGQDQQAISNMANIPFASALGDILPKRGESIPGIMVFRYHPSFGYSVGKASEYLNKLADAQYAQALQAFSAPQSIEAPDFVIYTHAVYGIGDLLMEGERAYGLVRKFSNYNQYYGETLLSQLGFNYDSLKSNLADFRSRFNIIVDQINKSFKVPKNSNLLKHRFHLCSRVYADGYTPKAQKYAFVPTTYGRYSAVDDTRGTCLRALNYETQVSYNKFANGGWTVDDYFHVLETLVGGLQGDQDVNNMSGIFLRAYGQENCLMYEHLDDNYETMIEYDETILKQIHNVMIAPYESVVGYGVAFYPDKTDGDIPCILKQANGRLVSEQTLHVTTGAALKALEALQCLDLPTEQPTAGEVLDSTRFMFGIRKVNSTPGVFALYSGSEVITSCHVTFMSENEEDGITATTHVVRSWIVTDENVPFNEFQDMCRISKFDWHPAFFIGTSVNNYPDGLDRYALFRDEQNVSELDNDYICTLNSKTFYTLLNVMDATYSSAR